MLTSSPPPSHEQDLKSKNTIPVWLPVTLLAVSTVALAVPIVLLRRQRINALANASAPRRRSSGSLVALKPAPTPVQPSPLSLDSEATKANGPTNFNAGLDSVKAFGIATVLVALAASAGVWGVKSYLGVKNTEEFGHRMRVSLIDKMPVLSSRIHRSVEEGDEVETLLSPEEVQYKWEDAQVRLSKAYEKDGFGGWADQALQEVEIEAKLDRIKRNLLQTKKP